MLSLKVVTVGLFSPCFLKCGHSGIGSSSYFKIVTVGCLVIKVDTGGYASPSPLCGNSGIGISSHFKMVKVGGLALKVVPVGYVRPFHF